VINVIKVRVEATESEIAQVVEILQERFEDIEITGVYDLKGNKSRAYIDISR
jgi:hypothetical protein